MKELAKGVVSKLPNGKCIPMRLDISESQFKKVESGGKVVKIRGHRPFFMGRGPNSKGKDRYWFAFVDRTPVFFPMKKSVAKEILGMAVPTGELRDFKTPGWQQTSEKMKKMLLAKVGTEFDELAFDGSPKKAPSRAKAYIYILRKGYAKKVKKSDGTIGIVMNDPFSKREDNRGDKTVLFVFKNGKAIEVISFPSKR